MSPDIQFVHHIFNMGDNVNQDGYIASCLCPKGDKYLQLGSMNILYNTSTDDRFFESKPILDPKTVSHCMARNNEIVGALHLALEN